MDTSHRSTILDYYLSKLTDFFSLHLDCERTRWTTSTLHRPIRSFDLDKSLQLHKFLNRVQNDFDLDHNLVDGLISIIISIIESNGVECGEYVTRARTLDQSFTLLARKLITELFKISKYARVKLVQELLRNCLESSKKRAVYIDQLTIMLNSVFAVEFFLEPTFQTNRASINSIVIETLTSSASKSGSSKRTSSLLGLFQLRDDPRQAAALIRALSLVFYTSDKSRRDNFAVLVDYLEQFAAVNKENELVRDTCILSLVELVRSLNAQVTTHKDHTPDIYRISRSRHLNDNNSNSANILKSLKRLLGETNSAVTKSYVYERLYSIVKSNPGLVESVCGLLEQRLGLFVAKDGYMDLTKCISVSTSKSVIITEPIDVLLHCSMLVMHKSGNVCARSSASAIRAVNSLRGLVNWVFTFYSNNEAEVIYNVYKSQISRSDLSAGSFKALHQLQLGFYDVVIEILVMHCELGRIPKMLEKYEISSRLISLDIENRMTEALTSSQVAASQPVMTTTTTTSRKRKLPGGNKENAAVSTTALKRFKSNDEDKEVKIKC